MVYIVLWLATLSTFAVEDISRQAGGEGGTDSVVEYGGESALSFAPPPEGEGPQKYCVRITSYRRRLLDEDNLCEKFHVDTLRYVGLLPNDKPNEVRILVRQEKIKTEEPERTIIEIWTKD